MTKHTPGPWVIAPYNGKSIRFIVTEEDCVIADCWPYIDPYYRNANDKRYKCRKKPNEADARLISAAPELLEALKDLVALIEAEFAIDADLRNARSAIAKATGEE